MTDDEAARKTYRYVRLGMIGAVALLAVSVLNERSIAPGCWQTSISAYYYTPARAIFVGALLAVGLSLIVIKGSTTAEDICLNAAGMLAPLVALVPTSNAGSCWSIKPSPLPTHGSGDNAPVQEWVGNNIDNNVVALLVAGLFGLILATAVAWVALRIRPPSGQAIAAFAAVKRNRETVLGLTATGGSLIGFALWLLVAPEAFHEAAHGLAAIGMFSFLAGAAFANAWDTKSHGRFVYARVYALTGVAMICTGALFLVPSETWRHRVLWIEALEIAWFLLLWTAQTRELWHDTLRRSPQGD